MAIHFVFPGGLFMNKGSKKVPAIEIAGLCLPLKPQKENVMLKFNN
jgi:hypothetical protein